MSSASKTAYITPEAYLARERLAEFKSEYIDGQIYAMAGTSFRHNIIAGNLFSEIRSQLGDRPCQPTIGDVRLRIDATGIYTYPDIMLI